MKNNPTKKEKYPEAFFNSPTEYPSNKGATINVKPPTNNFLQPVGLPHCFYCHKEHQIPGGCTPDTKENSAQTTPCTEKCGKWFNILTPTKTAEEMGKEI